MIIATVLWIIVNAWMISSRELVSYDHCHCLLNDRFCCYLDDRFCLFSEWLFLLFSKLSFSNYLNDCFWIIPGIIFYCSLRVSRNRCKRVPCHFKIKVLIWSFVFFVYSYKTSCLLNIIYTETGPELI